MKIDDSILLAIIIKGIISCGLFLNVALLSQICRQIVKRITLFIFISFIFITQLILWLLPRYIFIDCSGVGPSSLIFILVFG